MLSLGAGASALVGPAMAALAVFHRPKGEQRTAQGFTPEALR
jgi:hypothetical protein